MTKAGTKISKLLRRCALQFSKVSRPPIFGAANHIKPGQVGVRKPEVRTLSPLRLSRRGPKCQINYLNLQNLLPASSKVLLKSSRSVICISFVN